MLVEFKTKMFSELNSEELDDYVLKLVERSGERLTPEVHRMLRNSMEIENCLSIEDYLDQRKLYLTDVVIPDIAEYMEDCPVDCPVDYSYTDRSGFRQKFRLFLVRHPKITVEFYFLYKIQPNEYLMADIALDVLDSLKGGI